MDNNEDIPEQLKGANPKEFTQGMAVVLVTLLVILAVVGIVSIFLK
jgi:hypothetical protein